MLPAKDTALKTNIYQWAGQSALFCHCRMLKRDKTLQWAISLKLLSICQYIGTKECTGYDLLFQLELSLFTKCWLPFLCFWEVGRTKGMLQSKQRAYPAPVYWQLAPRCSFKDHWPSNYILLDTDFPSWEGWRVCLTTHRASTPGTESAEQLGWTSQDQHVLSQKCWAYFHPY